MSLVRLLKLGLVPIFLVGGFVVHPACFLGAIAYLFYPE
jgi:hypothetical protein